MGGSISPAAALDLNSAVKALAKAHDAWANRCKRANQPIGPEIVYADGRRDTFKDWLERKGGFDAFRGEGP